MPNASSLVTAGIASLGVLVPALVVLAVYLSSPRPARLRLTATVGLAVVALLATSFTLAQRGVLASQGAGPPRMLLVLAPTLVLPFALGLSRVGARLAELPLPALVGVHAFRLPLELVMHAAAAEGTMPAQMSYSGWNFDILTGIAAIAVGALAARGQAPRWALLGFAALGSALLAVVVTIAVLSLPAFAAFGAEPSRLNTWVAHPPFVWLPCALVSSAILGHIVLWRRLLGQPGRRLLGAGTLAAPR